MRDDAPHGSAPQTGPVDTRLTGRVPRGLGIAIDLLAMALFVAAGWRMATTSWGQVREPLDLVYETPNVRTIELCRAGLPIYAPQIYGDVPYVFTMYPPLYHALVAALPIDPVNPYVAGRIVACIAMVAAAGMLVFVGGRESLPTALLAIGSLWLFHPSTKLAAFVKSDSLGLLFSLVAVLAVARAQNQSADRPAAVGAAILCALAVWTKHGHLAAPLACLLGFAVRGGPGLRYFLATTAALAAVSLTVAATAWGGDMLWCLAAGVGQPPAAAQFAAVWKAAAGQPFFVVLFAVLHVQAVLLARQEGLRSRHAAYLWYLLAADAVMLAGLGKSGSSVNYFFEPLLAGAACFVTARDRMPRAVTWPLAAVLVLAGGWEVATADPRAFDLRLLGCPAADVAGQRDWIADKHAAAAERTAAVIAVTNPAPRILNLCNARFGRDLPGEISLSDPYLYGLLFAQGSLPVDPLIARLDAGSFDGVLLPPDHDPRQRRRSPALAALYAAVHRTYRPGSAAPGLAVWVRR